MTKNGLKIIGRKKQIFKLAQGEYVSPERLENVFQKSEFIDQIFIHGDSYQTYLVSFNSRTSRTKFDLRLLGRYYCYKYRHCNSLGEEQGARRKLEFSVRSIGSTNFFLKTSNLDKLCTSNELFEQIMFEVVKYATVEKVKILMLAVPALTLRQQLLPYEIPRNYHLTTEKFTIENKRMTSSEKICRPQLETDFKQLLQDLYKTAESATGSSSLFLFTEMYAHTSLQRTSWS